MANKGNLGGAIVAALGRTTTTAQVQPRKEKLGKDKSAKEKQGRQLVDHEHVCKLVHDYWKYFTTFNKGQKKNTKQLIPNKVWIDVYKDYLQEFSTSTFKADSLKDHLKDSLKDITSGVKNLDDGETTKIQEEDLMKKLMNIESWKAHNILKLWDDFMTGRSNKSSMTSSTSSPIITGKSSLVAEVAPSRPLMHFGRSDSVVGKPPTKSQNLKRDGEDIANLLYEFKTM